MENGLSALYLLKVWMDFDQTCTNILLGNGQEVFRIGDLDPFFKVTGGPSMLGNGLSAPYFLKKWVDFDQTCTGVFLGH